ncbi:hypothetical protein WJX73_001528 [Symbiochloris irregularis]|uniref:Uncharacterized protein n=1 Tax=Symbiochloris irregularis TaxID=706552 RepID=A0AAW1NQ15_9CHLO
MLGSESWFGASVENLAPGLGTDEHVMQWRAQTWFYVAPVWNGSSRGTIWCTARMGGDGVEAWANVDIAPVIEKRMSAGSKGLAGGGEVPAEWPAARLWG